jgi:alkylhydroperoxidase/carboxymuconolactone decarboxylase family protein YurZ
MFDDISSLRRARKVYNAKMFHSAVATFRQLEDLEAGALADGALPQKYKELIALGISIAESCEG